MSTTKDQIQAVDVIGRKIFIQAKSKSHELFRYFNEDKENPGQPETTPFATVDRPEDIDATKFVARCGSRVTELNGDHGDHLGVICWALKIPRPPLDPEDIATFTSRQSKK